MKSLAVCIVLILVTTVSSLAQDIEAMLSSSSTSSGFTVRSPFPLPPATFTRFSVRGNGFVGIGTINPEFRLTIETDGGIIAKGSNNAGADLTTSGVGTRMIWYPKKAAFRAGYVSGSQWDDSNIGSYSMAAGQSTLASAPYSAAFGGGTTASGANSVAMGISTTASGSSSIAMGQGSIAGGQASAAFGNGTTASGLGATAMGGNTTASGLYCTATGFTTTASGDYSTAMGRSASTNGKDGSFVIGDNSTSTFLLAGSSNAFKARFAGGYDLLTNAAMTVGARLPANGNSWGIISDRRKKERLVIADGEHVLAGFRSLTLGSWNYIGQDAAQYRHYGAIAQEWFAAFGHDGIGTIGSDTLLASADVDGVLCIAVKALEQRTAELNEKSAEISSLRSEVAVLKKQVASMADVQARLASLESSLGNRTITHGGEQTTYNFQYQPVTLRGPK